MKVYVVKGIIKYEGFQILGVFSSMKKAKEKVAKDVANGSWYHNIEISQCELNESVVIY